MIKYLHLPKQRIHDEVAKVRAAGSIAGNDRRW
jgi:hypothetical protein